MSEVASPRAKLVELLWQLKQAYDKHGVDSDVRFIHFNTLLNDSHYRRELIDRSLQSGHAQVRQLAARLSELDQAGELLNKRSSGRPAGVPLMLNPDIAETIGREASEKHARQGRRWWLVTSLALIAIAGVALWQSEWTLPTLGNDTRVSGSITASTHWGADRTWILDGIVYVENKARLTIDAGTRVLGLPGAALVITRGSTLDARGTAEKPVIFTSAQPEGARTRGDWGGLVLLGAAPVNRANAQIEGVPENDLRGQFGGADPSHNCGVITHTRIEFAGYEVYKDNELNGLTLGGCGSNTLIDHVQVHQALDDGVEVFGGNVDLRHVLITGAGDDALDWDMGWQGRVQFLAVQQHSSIGDNAFEGDSNKSNPDALPRSHPVMYNVTLVSPRSHEKHQRAMTLRRGTAGEFHNLIIEGFSGETLDVRDGSTVTQAMTGSLVIDHAIIHRIGQRGLSWFESEHRSSDDDSGFDEATWVSAGGNVLFGTDPLLPREASRMSNPSFVPATSSPARSGAAQPPQGEFWDEAADYLGAFRPGTTRPWTVGWTDFPIK